jgi:hypothetical protein
LGKQKEKNNDGIKKEYNSGWILAGGGQCGA